MSDLDRTVAAGLGEQIAGRVVTAIEGGRLTPGDRLPPTRALAEQAGVNHLTAVRAYRRLAERGYVTSAVGRGTFVRAAPAVRDPGDGVDWQAAVLPGRGDTYAGDILRETFRLPADPGMISLATGWPDPALYPVEELARLTGEVFAQERGGALSYLDPAGLPALREELALRGRALGFASDAEEIIVTSGARQGLDLVTRAILGPGDVVAVESPTFVGTLSSLQATGAQVIGIPTDVDGLDVDALEGVLARHEIKLCVLQSSCQNPTGRDLSPQRAERLVALSRQRSFFVLEDGVYATVRFDGAERSRLRVRAPGHVVYVDSLSKTIGGGLRLGWIAASGALLGRLVQLKLGSDVHTSSLVQHLAARYLAGDDHDRMLARTLPIYEERRDALLESVERRLPGEVTFDVPLGGHHVWLTLTQPTDEALLFREALAHGTAFTPGAAALAEATGPGHLRLSFSLEGPERLDEGVRRLAAALRAVRRHQPARGATLAIS